MPSHSDHSNDLDPNDAWKAELEPFYVDVAQLGVPIEHVQWSDFGDLQESQERYGQLVDVCLRHLENFDYSDDATMYIAAVSHFAWAHIEPKDRRAFASVIRKHWDRYVALYKKQPHEAAWISVGGKIRHSRAKEQFAQILFESVNPKTMPSFLELLRDRANGSSRGLFMVAMQRRRKQKWVREFLKTMVDDPDLGQAAKDLLADKTIMEKNSLDRGGEIYLVQT